MNKYLRIISFAALMISFQNSHSQGVLGRIKQKAKDKVSQRADDKIDKAMDKGLDNAEDAAKKSPSNKGEKDGVKSKKNNGVMQESSDSTSSTVSPISINAYQNYDFVPEDNILFEDSFADDQDGEFPAHWVLEAGQGVVNKVKGDKAFFMTEGNYARFNPRMKKETYLTDPFTIEYDMYYVPNS